MSNRDNKRTGAIIGTISALAIIGGAIIGTTILVSSKNSSNSHNSNAVQNVVLAEVKKEPIISYKQETENSKWKN